MKLRIEWANHACQMVLLTLEYMNCWLYPEGNKKGAVTSIKNN
jgi:hypothetical protein